VGRQGSAVMGCAKLSRPGPAVNAVPSDDATRVCCRHAYPGMRKGAADDRQRPSRQCPRSRLPGRAHRL